MNNLNLEFSNIRVLSHRDLISIRVDIGEDELVVVGLNATETDWYLNKYIKSINNSKMYIRVTDSKEIEKLLGITLDDLDKELSKLLNNNINIDK